MGCQYCQTVLLRDAAGCGLLPAAGLVLACSVRFADSG